MKRIPLEQAQPGMILAQQLVRDDGVLLAQKGSELTEGLLRILARMNFETVAIEVVSEESPEEREDRIAQEAAEIESRFQRVAGDSILMALKQALLDRLHEDAQEDADAQEDGDAGQS
jgi:hypothetical protein